MNRRKLMILILIPMIISFSIFSGDVQAKTPAEIKGKTQYYDRSASSIERFEDLFFPHQFTGEISKELYLEEHWGNETFVNSIQLDKEYQDFNQPPYFNKSDLPPDYRPANLTLRNDKGDMIYSFANTGIGIDGMGTVNFNLTDMDTVNMNSTGGFFFYISSNPTWENPFVSPEHIDFKGRTRTFNLWGYNQGISEFDQREQYIKVNIHSNTPIRAYIFEEEEGKLVDYDESIKKDVSLKIMNEENPMSVGDIPFLTISTPTYTIVNATFMFEVCDYPVEGWVLPAVIGMVVGITVVLLIWYKKQS